MGDNRQEIISEFQMIGTTLENNIIDKCVSLCELYDISGADFVELWAVFRLNNTQFETPANHSLEIFEKKYLVKEGNAGKKRKTEVMDMGSPNRLVNSPKALPSPRTPKVAPPSPKALDDLNISASTQNIEGVVLCSYGPKIIDPKCKIPVNVKLVINNDETFPSTKEFMYEIMTQKAQYLSDVTLQIGNNIATKYCVALPSVAKSYASGDYICGRVSCEGEGKINPASISLEMPLSLYPKGEIVHLNIADLKSYALFPGQTVIAQGELLKNKFTVKNLLSSAYKIPDTKLELEEPLSIICASGPFTLINNFTYDPLQDLLRTVVPLEPHVLILMGPFLDENNEEIASGKTDDVYTFFDLLVDTIMTAFEGKITKIVFISSQKDVHHVPVYPTPPYQLKQPHPNLYCFPDPSMINIGGLNIGITTVDVLLHMAQNQISSSNPGDRMSYLSKFILDQMCFYPIYPPDENVIVDYGFLSKFGIMESSPDILIIPSVLKYFTKKVAGTLVVNPEHLVKGFTKSVYAKFLVKLNKEISCEIIGV